MTQQREDDMTDATTRRLAAIGLAVLEELITPYTRATLDQAIRHATPKDVVDHLATRLDSLAQLAGKLTVERVTLTQQRDYLEQDVKSYRALTRSAAELLRAGETEAVLAAMDTVLGIAHEPSSQDGDAAPERDAS